MNVRLHMVGTRSTESPFEVEIRDAVERVPTKFIKRGRIDAIGLARDYAQDKASDLDCFHPLAVLDAPTGIQDHFLAGFDTVENLDFGAAGASGFDCP